MRVKYFAYYRDITGTKAEDVAHFASIGELLRFLVQRYGSRMHEKLLSPDGTALGGDAIVLINGRNIAHLGMLDAPLKETDVVAIFPIVAGG